MGNHSFGLGWAKAVEFMTEKFRTRAVLIAVVSFAVGVAVGVALCKYNYIAPLTLP